MSLVVRAQLRFLWRARGSMLSALLGMTIGVASVVGVHLLSAQVALRVGQQAQPVGDVDLYLQRESLSDGDYFQLRARWRAGELPRVAAMFPLIEGEVSLGDESYLLVGTDPLAAGRLQVTPGQTEVSSEGSAQNRSQLASFLVEDSVFLPGSLQGSASSGAQINVAEAHKVAGRISLGGRRVQVLGYSAPERVILADLPSARSILCVNEADAAESMRLSRIGIRLDAQSKPAGIQALAGHLARQLFPGALAEPVAQELSALDASWQQTPAANQDPTQQLLRSVLFNVAALSVLALVVAWLLTYQVACHALGRRSGMFVRLQSLGVSRNRLRRLTQIEGLVLGLCATGLGALLGLLLANLLLSLALGETFQLALKISGYAWFKALLSGVGVAGLSYWLAADQSLFRVAKTASSGFSKVSSGTASSVVERASGWPSQLILFALLLGVFCWGLLGGTLVGAFACIVVSALCLIIYLPALAQWLWQRTLTPAAQQNGSTLRLLGVRQVLIGKELRLGVSALALALATALGISIMVDSFRGAFVEMLDQRLADDVVLKLPNTATQRDRVELDEQVRPLVRSGFWRGVAPVSVQGVAGRLEFSDSHEELLARFFSEQSVADNLQHASADSVFVNESFARLHELTLAMPISLQGERSAQTAVVAGVFTDFGEVRPRLLATREMALKLQGVAPLNELYLRTEQLQALRVELASWLDKSRLTLRDQAQIRTRSIEIFEQTFAITRALTWLALLVAAVALANALAAHGLQQQGVARQLDVLGLGSSAQRRLGFARTGYVAGVSVVLALPLGLVIAALLCYAVNPRAFGWSFAMQLTPAGVGWPLLGGALGGLFAAALGDWLAHRQTRVNGSMTSVARAYSGVTLLALAVIVLGGCSVEQEPAPSTVAGSAPSLRVGSVLSGDAEGFARATKIVPFDFPRDHGAHPAYRSEWWYLTCPLSSADKRTADKRSAKNDGEAKTAAEYGVQFTLFRQALAPAQTSAQLVTPAQTAQLWRTGQMYMAHVALSDVGGQRHYEDSRLTRGHPALAGVLDHPFTVWLEDWRLGVVDGDSVDLGPGALGALQLEIKTAEFSVNLRLQQEKAIVLQGDRGLSYKGSREASYYYSVPRFSAAGMVQTHANPSKASATVEGTCWLDREWSTSVLADNLVGWDWFALQFDDNSELMLFQLRGDESDSESADSVGSAARRQGKLVARDGSSESLVAAELHFEPQRYWQDETGKSWPVEWQISTPSRRMRVVAALDDQRMRSSVDYWEGLVWVFEDNLRVGQGYLEMTGYTQ